MNFAILVAILVACATLPPDLIVTDPQIVADKESQALFDDAIRWSRLHGLETGGCFKVWKVIGNNVIVTDAVESVNWRRAHVVQLRCGRRDGIWHTHWSPEDSSRVGCNVQQRAKDVFLIGPESILGLVVCGVGRDSLIPFHYDAVADSLNQQHLKQNPEYAKAEERARKEYETYRCANEPHESLKRSGIKCKN